MRCDALCLAVIAVSLARSWRFAADSDAVTSTGRGCSASAYSAHSRPLGRGIPGRRVGSAAAEVGPSRTMAAARPTAAPCPLLGERLRPRCVPGRLHLRVPPLVDDLLRRVPPAAHFAASLLRPSAPNTNITAGPVLGGSTGVPVAPTANLHVRWAAVQPMKERYPFDTGNPRVRECSGAA
jgi:hypothetical protein